MKKLDFFRKKYPQFVFEKYSWKIFGETLKVSFNFLIEPDIRFHPKLIILNASNKFLKKKEFIDNLVFHLGLIEIPSYWKATCSPKILVKCGFLDSDQKKWWKDLIIKGMGQFFYENTIDWRVPGFLKIDCENSRTYRIFPGDLKGRYLVPVGGGRDGIVTLELLKKQKKQVNCFLVNPTRATKKVMKAAGIKNPIVVQRKIDPALLELNKKGYLNGHTPFTALLSFLSVFCAVLFDFKNVVFSNEKSANEGNVRYLGKTINHQWAKSSEFEKMFREYCKKYLAKNINYLNFLRNFTEFEISKMFAKYPKYFSAFSSCNLGQKRGERWCKKCPKCLFVYLTLYPFLSKKELLKIFGKDIFKNKKLLPAMKSLLGKDIKPFECVGTKKESRLAFNLSLAKAKKEGKIPYILKNAQ